MIVIYSIINLINDKQYVGSTVNKNTRWSRHKTTLNKNIHPNKHLQAAWNKYGTENFIFIIITKCEKKELLTLEQLYIDILKPEYNKQLIAGSPLGTKHSNETKAKMSAWQIGRKLSEETKLKQSKASKGKLKSIEHKQKLAIVNLGKKQSREIIEKQVASRKLNSSWKHPNGRKCKCEECVQRKRELKRIWRATSDKSDQFPPYEYI